MNRKKKPFKFNRTEVVTRNVTVFATSLKRAEKMAHKGEGVPHKALHRKITGVTRIFGSWSWKPNRKLAK